MIYDMRVMLLQIVSLVYFLQICEVTNQRRWGGFIQTPTVQIVKQQRPEW